MSAPAVDQERRPFESWAEAVGLTMDEPQPRDFNAWQTDTTDEEWQREAGHWWVTLRVEGRELSFPFSMGSAHRRFKATARHSHLWPFLQSKGAKVPTGPRREGSRIPQLLLGVRWLKSADADELRRITEPIPPTLEELLECMQSDAGGFWDGPTFEEWAGEYGYDTDSRRALALYIRCQEHARHITRFLGEHFEPFMEIEP